jgi:hypothetical protein
VSNWFGSQYQHRVAVTIKAKALFDRIVVGAKHSFTPGKSAN